MPAKDISLFFEEFFSSPESSMMLYPSSLSGLRAASEFYSYAQAKVSFASRSLCIQNPFDEDWLGTVVSSLSQNGTRTVLLLGFPQGFEFSKNQSQLQIAQLWAESPQNSSTFELAGEPVQDEGCTASEHLCLLLEKDKEERWDSFSVADKIEFFDLLHLDFFAGGPDKAIECLRQGEVTKAHRALLKYRQDRFSQLQSGLLKGGQTNALEASFKDYHFSILCLNRLAALREFDSDSIQLPYRSEFPLLSSDFYFGLPSEDEEAYLFAEEEFGSYLGTLAKRKS